MIWESQPWRDELARIADRFESWRESYDLDDEQVAFEQERDAFLSAFIVRKLIEARKLSNSLLAATVTTDAFPLIDRAPDHMNWHRLGEFYDWERVVSTTLNLEQLCNQLIHSFVFVVETSEDQDDTPGTPAGLRALLVSSDRQRHKALLRIDISDFIDVLRRVAVEEVVSVRMVRDKSGNWVVFNLSVEDIAAQDST
jgi:hypothetical protein